MRPIDTYPVSFPFGATSAPYTPSSPHRGDDRAAPQGTPVIVGGVTIGLVGMTGLATGPHLHLQEWNGQVRNARKPQNAFKAGVVVASSASSDFGNYVTIQCSDGWSDSYCHLSQINVKVGQVIGGNGMTQDGAEKLVSQAYRAATDIDPTAEQAGYWVERIKGNPNTAHELLAALGGNDYKGDPMFREKARNYDKDVAAASGGFVPSPQTYIKQQ